MRRRTTGGGYRLVIVLTVGVAPAFAQTTTQPSTADKTVAADEVLLLKQQVAAQQKQLEQMQAAMTEMKARLDRAEGVSQITAAASGLPVKPASLGQVASLTPVVPKAPAASTASASILPTDPTAFYNNGASPADEQGVSPLSFKIGGAEFTPGGFLDFTVFTRSTNLGSGIASAFGNAPYSNTAAGRLSETRVTMQNSRLSLDVNSKYVGFDLHGHVEADFLGFAPPNVFVTTNSNTFRARLYWLDARKDKFEFLGGQSWSMMTPNRTGLSANPSDIFYSQNMDTNYQVGLIWARQAQFRLIYHPMKAVAAGISIENPQQYYGNATVPSSMAAQGDNGSGSVTNSNAANDPATPNVAPDIIAKVALDPMAGNLHEHIEFAGLLTFVRTFDPTAGVHDSAVGGGAAINFNLEVVKNLHFILNTFYSDGGGRYIFALAPSFIINRDANGAYHPSLVHSSSAIAGLEYQLTPKTMLYGYYGAAYSERNFGIDCFLQPIPVGSPAGTTAACTSATSSKPSYIGYGYPGAPNSQNKSVQEPTFGVIQTFWKNPHYGALTLITQYSYLTRAPWFVASGAPKNAHLSMGYVDLRYTLP